MAERKYEDMLNIRTTGLREWRNESHYHRYEATPYRALEELFKVYKLERDDEVVDFGCGRGRVSFYIHNRFKVPVTGVEVNDLTFDEALDNKRSYRYKASHIEAPIRFNYALAEQFDVDETDTVFYFFNPFSVDIFKKVVQNILKSVQVNHRPIDLILYYPTGSYKNFIAKNTPFRLMNKVRVPGAQDKKEKFLVYRLAN
ncbi:class I SAM-dependent methyltransferase [Sporosarcina pasteurii]|uniref:Methyltransferase domain-containing protein n=1 Tax=Sporosarcina pasteurii TaxID=1474 RepID=A0A380CJT2_SPOPA|nr:class I SAM-dependent methyltransferase [Sporosarcina pasteurii]MDS9471882.1 class I SAM-dependent methyltransferase [Sporosarcina pasteurii]QBQ06619.1 class I SAM-dependent methyltransferase [Sporosarcina pasteurii]SUJ21982.1 Uncharacterised protein [Sporosarcina pasteurii]